MSRFKLPKPHVTRDLTLFLFGLSGLGYETLVGGPEKPTLIIAFVGMLGLPLFIRNDEARKNEVTPPPVVTPPAVSPPAPPVETEPVR